MDPSDTKVQVYYWDLSNNDFVPIDPGVAKLKDYEPIRTLSGKTVYIERVTDIYGRTLAKALEVSDAMMAKLAPELEAQHIKIEEFHKLSNDLKVDGLLGSLRYQSVAVDLIVGKRRSLKVKRAIFRYAQEYEMNGYWQVPRDLSKAFCKTIREKIDLLDIDTVCRDNDINPTTFRAMMVGDVTRVFLKAFVVEGAAFVLARIISSKGITVAREGVSEAVSAEMAELVLLSRVSKVAEASKTQVEIITRNMNLVNWINRKSRAPSHPQLRAEILAWLKPLGYSARQMTDVEHKAYRDEKKGKL